MSYEVSSCQTQEGAPIWLPKHWWVRHAFRVLLEVCSPPAHDAIMLHLDKNPAALTILKVPGMHPRATLPCRPTGNAFSQPLAAWKRWPAAGPLFIACQSEACGVLAATYDPAVGDILTARQISFWKDGQRSYQTTLAASVGPGQDTVALASLSPTLGPPQFPWNMGGRQVRFVCLHHTREPSYPARSHIWYRAR